jgi:hypothetical protein
MKSITPGQLRALSSWNAMMQRCFDPECPSYASYGGRGITVCERWLNPWVLISDLGERPQGTSLGRVDNDGIYEPSNCRWETPQEQASNTRRSVFVGEMTQASAARSAGLSASTLSRRRQRGEDIEAPAYFKRTKLDQLQVAAIKVRLQRPGSNAAIGREFGVSGTLVSQIRCGTAWAGVGLKQPEPQALDWGNDA